MPTLGEIAPTSITTTPTTTKTWGEWLTDGVLRYGVPTVGTLLTGVIAPPLAPVAGTVLGASGELAAQAHELGNPAVRSHWSPGRVAVAAVANAVPGANLEGAIASPWLRIPAEAAIDAVPAMGAATAGSVVDRGELPTMGELATAGLMGFGTSAAFRGAAEGLRTVAARRVPGALPEAEPPVPPAGSPDMPEAPARPAFIKAPGLGEAATGQPIPAAVPRPAKRLQGELDAVDRMFADKSPTARDALRTVIGDNADLIAVQVRDQQPIERTRGLARDLLFDPSKPLPKGTALNAEQIGSVAGMVSALDTKVQRLAEAVASGTADDATKLQLKIAQQELTTSMLALQGGKGEIGRSMNFLRYLKDAALSDNPTFIAKANKKGATPDQIADALGSIAPDDLEGRFQFLRGLQQPGPKDWVNWYRYTNMLSGPVTHIRNIAGNVANLGKTVAATPFAGAVDRVVTPKDADRMVYAGEITPQLVGAWSGLQDGLDRAAFMFTHGYSKADLTSLTDRPPEVPGGVVTNVVGRSLSATDELFKGLAFSMELHAGAYRQARNEVLRAGGGDVATRVTDRMQQLLTEKPPALLQQAAQFADRATYQEPLGPVARHIQQAIDHTTGGLGRWIVPFIKTPSNVMKQGVQLSPVGAVTELARSGTRVGAQARGEALLGTLLAVPFIAAARRGILTGNGPTDAAERDALRAQGWQPNSVRIGDRYVPAQLVLGTAAVPALTIANAIETGRALRSKSADAETGKVIAVAISKSLGSMLDASWMQGASALQKALADPERFGANLLSGTAQQFVPLGGALRTVRNLQDPTVRQPEGVVQEMQNMIPGQSTQVLPRLSATGQPAKRDPGVAGLLGISTAQPDPVRQELGRLGEPFPVRDRRSEIRVGNRKEPITPREDAMLRQAMGVLSQRRVTSYLQAPGYQTVPDALKQRHLRQVMDDTRDLILKRAQALRSRGESLSVARLIAP